MIDRPDWGKGDERTGTGPEATKPSTEEFGFRQDWGQKPEPTHQQLIQQMKAEAPADDDEPDTLQYDLENGILARDVDGRVTERDNFHQRERDPATGRYVTKAPVTRDNWGNRSTEIAPPGEEATDAGVGWSLLDKMSADPDAFEGNYSRMLDSLIDAADSSANPLAVASAFENSPPSLRTKIAHDCWAYPSSSIEQRYKRVQAKATLTESAALGRLMQAARNK
jgi:hypothetical protein